MEDYREAIKEAMNIYKRRHGLDHYGKEDAVNTLAEHGIWSKIQISKIVGVAPYFVSQRIVKSDNRGGRLNPESFDLLLEAIALKDMGENNPELMQRIVDEGTSAPMISRLTGEPLSTIYWRRGMRRVAEVVALPIWPHEMTEERMEMLKRAKAEAEVAFLVVPAPAVPGSPGRVLAFGLVPEHAADVIYIHPSNVDRYESVRDALHYWLKGESVPPTISMAEWLSAAMGCDVTLLANEVWNRETGEWEVV